MENGTRSEGPEATHYITRDDIREWLAEYGVDTANVSDVAIEIGRHYGTGDVSAWLDVTWWAKNHLSSRYLSGQRGQAASGTSTIPLHSFPRLTPAEAAEQGQDG